MDKDCDDLDPTSTSVESDSDCDGIVYWEDCNDSDADITTTTAEDSDCDGVPGAACGDVTFEGECADDDTHCSAT